jgi:hypothetical protein
MTDPWLQATFEGAQAKSRELASHYEALAEFFKVDFLNAGEFLTTDGIDGIHLTAQNNTAPGIAAAEKIKTIFTR